MYLTLDKLEGAIREIASRGRFQEYVSVVVIRCPRKHCAALEASLWKNIMPGAKVVVRPFSLWESLFCWGVKGKSLGGK